MNERTAGPESMATMAYTDARGIIAASVVLEMLAATAVALRFLSIRRRQAKHSASDWLIVAALVGSLGLAVVEIYGVAVHALADPVGFTFVDDMAAVERVVRMRHLQYAYFMLGVATFGVIKLSVACLYWQIFITRAFRRFLAVWIVFLILWTLCFVLSVPLQCGVHLTAMFDNAEVFMRYCHPNIGLEYACACSDTATDLITILIPIPMIWSLQMPNKKKLLTILIFMVAMIPLAASIARAYIYIMSEIGSYKEKDAILTATGMSVWNMVEAQVGIIAACGPTLRTIIGEIFPMRSLISLASMIRNHVAPSKRTIDEESYTRSQFNKDLTKWYQIDFATKAEVVRPKFVLPIVQQPDRIYVRSKVVVELEC